ncbi:MAG: hypothetical protein R3A52_19120 [Polyangiales bacterium]
MSPAMQLAVPPTIAGMHCAPAALPKGLHTPVCPVMDEGTHEWPSTHPAVVRSERSHIAPFAMGASSSTVSSKLPCGSPGVVVPGAT